MDQYAPIADHGLIGDLRTAALVTTDGTIDWFCYPRFDSPSVFGALLDHRRGGHFGIHPARRPYRSTQLYFPDTAVLITRFLAPEGTGEVIDFMPPRPRGPATGNHRLVRMVRCVRGRVEFEVEVAPRFDYGRQPHSTVLTEHGAVFDAGTRALTLHVVRDRDDVRPAEVWISQDTDVGATLTLTAGQVRGVVLESGAEGLPREIRPEEIRLLLDHTVEFWQSWLAGSTYRGRWREAVNRSAVTLKLLTYAPTGAIVAAPTAGLPEQLGGERNWDYRYTWIRDASFSVNSLLGLGLRTEAEDFAHWLGDRYRQRPEHSDGPLQLMYRVDGSADLREETLEHWEGYRGSRPVRIGNDAAGQLQLDIYGEALDSLYQAHQHGVALGHGGWQAVVDLLDWLTVNWNRPDEGIWETRGGRADFTYGRLMSWVAFDRAIRLAEQTGRPGPVQRWRNERDHVYTQIFAHGWDPVRSAFVQTYGSTVLDSSLLRMPKVGFVDPRDPLWLSTLSAIGTDLVTDSLVYRYDPAVSPDGLTGAEGTFSLCTFGYVEALARAGALRQARLVFDKMLTYANHLGLYAEEIGLTGEQLGNFPQAFTHLALIDAALTLDRADHR
ncbi:MULTISPECIES: glycoside hydrolase family 15 protein [unclassified Crossiella]|uniref:glycoside hydrolase family 15 protein n=1 Tax=unclassified Crossiella TaxID=2620835 RepID=UPI0020002E76|nr:MULTISPECIES: glycoside hydrolase family 15 protein [unclassified Crossiella]MCK2243577.1 glycoside hydrolase family 15 protein [Crossiella sp. S99.2]MCK2257435.1 glycoside hydrolase family 15 protein [Crossiella sp. S99.1]